MNVMYRSQKGGSLLMEPGRTVWHNSATCSPSPKRAKKCYYVLVKEAEFLVFHPAPNSQVGQTASERTV